MRYPGTLSAGFSNTDRLQAVRVVFSRMIFRAGANCPQGICPAPDLKVYPEPAVHNVRLEFINRKPGRCAVTICDIAGRRVCALLDRLLNAGVHSATWDLTDGHGMRSVPGVYIVQVRTPETVLTRTVTVR
uniref:T9SS type A sorting domain-containing protein n=1 Tax=candidate division WOR-3 bacterium TaxID=2052148 RepID=A0A7C1NFS6_UNCW3